MLQRIAGQSEDERRKGPGPERPASAVAPDSDIAGEEARSRETRGPDTGRSKRGDEDPTAEPGEADDANTKDQRGKADKPGLWARLRDHPVAIGLAVIVSIAAIVAGTLWYLHARHFESTDDAFIDGRPVAISPEVTGNIVNVPVNDNQVVRAGDLLMEIDQRDFRASVDQAEAQIAQADANIVNFQSQVEAQRAQVEQAAKQAEEAKAALNFSKDQDTRAQQLVKTGFGTVQNAQQTASDLQSKSAALAAAEASQVAAERQVNVQKAEIKGAQGQRAQALAQKAAAEANLSRTQLHATVDARVTRLTAAVGAVATQGQAVMVLVPLDLWITANFKETQLADMRPGQPVDIEVDAYGRTFHGRVDSIQAGSGTAFSLLPAENATGNYVKVVQRIPVKMTFDQRPDVEIGPGMSVVPSVTVR